GGDCDPRGWAGGRPARGVCRGLRGSSGGTLADVSDADPRAVACARAILASDAYRQAQASASCYQDVPLLAMVDGVLLEQVADLVYETGGGRALVVYELGAGVGT